MYITKIELVKNKACKIYINEHFAFLLYESEVSRFHLVESQKVSQKTYDDIQALVIKRAKKKILKFLERKDYAENEIREKLRNKFFHASIIDIAVEYAKSYGYINEEHFIDHFIYMNHTRKSKKEIFLLLQNHGVQKDLLQNKLQTFYEQYDEVDTIKEIVAKKRYNIQNPDPNSKRKILAYLGRKGFCYADICKVFSMDEEF